MISNSLGERTPIPPDVAANGERVAGEQANLGVTVNRPVIPAGRDNQFSTAPVTPESAPVVSSQPVAEPNELLSIEDVSEALSLQPPAVAEQNAPGSTAAPVSSAAAANDSSPFQARVEGELPEEINFAVFERPAATAAATFDAGQPGSPQTDDEGPVAVVGGRADFQLNAGQQSLPNSRTVTESRAAESDQSRDDRPPTSPAAPFRRQLDLFV